jgi:hypothetical protein
MLVFHGLLVLLVFIAYIAIAGGYSLSVVVSGKCRGFELWYKMIFTTWCASVLVLGLTSDALFGFNLQSVFFWIAIGYISSSKHRVKWVDRLLEPIRAKTIHKLFPSLKLTKGERDPYND